MAVENLIEGVWRSLRLNRWKALLIIGVALAATTVSARYFPVVYESNSLLRVLSTEDVSKSELAASMNGLLSQRPVVQETLRDKGITRDPRTTADLFLLEDAGPGLVKLVVRHANPSTLRELGDTLIQTLSEQFLPFSSEADRLEQSALERKKEALEEKLTQLRQDLVTAQTQPLVSTDPPEKMAIDAELQAQAARLEEARRKVAEAPRTLKVASTEESEEYRRIKRELSRNREQLTDLLRNYREKHPRVVQANAEVAVLERSLKAVNIRRDREIPNPELETLQNDVAAAEARLSELQTQATEVAKAQTPVAPPPSPAVIEGRIKALEDLYQDVVVKLEGLSLKQQTAQGRIQVLQKDREGPQPIGLSVTQRQIIGVLCGTLLAVILLYTPAPRIPEIVAIPTPSPAGHAYPREREPEIEAIFRILQAPALTHTRLALPDPVASSAPCLYDERLIVLNEPDSRRLEPYRALRTNLEIQLSEAHIRIVLASSSRSNMGRTTLVANLGVLLAQDGYSVCLVDANLRKPALHRLFDQESAHGLSSILCGSGGIELIKKTKIKNLSLLPAGPIPPNPAQLLGSPAMIDLLDQLKRKYELVLIDAPALLDHPDAGILASLAAGVVFLNRQGEPEADIRAARDFLKTARTKVLGFVQT